MEQEIWKDIPGYEGLYQISTLGNIKSLDRYIKGKNNSTKKILGKKLKTRINRGGYYSIKLRKFKINNTLYVHRLVAITFIPNPENKPQVNHIDGNRLNNNVSNLEWVNSSENHLHKFRVLGYKNNFQNNHPMKGKFGKYHNRSKDYILKLE